MSRQPTKVEKASAVKYFEQVFRAVLTVVWERVLKAAGYATEEEVERVVNELMRFE